MPENLIMVLKLECNVYICKSTQIVVVIHEQNKLQKIWGNLHIFQIVVPVAI